jgi:hypothetical protein
MCPRQKEQFGKASVQKDSSSPTGARGHAKSPVRRRTDSSRRVRLALRVNATDHFKWHIARLEGMELAKSPGDGGLWCALGPKA